MALFAGLLVICSWMAIPFAVPVTLQTFGVFLTVGILGGKRGTVTVLVYLLLGMVGVPVFAGFAGGIGHLLGSSGGYLIGLFLMSLMMWCVEKVGGNRLWVFAVSMVAGLLVCYFVGIMWFCLVYAADRGRIGWWSALAQGVVPYVLPDVGKMVLAFVLYKRLSPLAKEGR